jgi:hypothetical protein
LYIKWKKKTKKGGRGGERNTVWTPNMTRKPITTTTTTTTTKKHGGYACMYV